MGIKKSVQYVDTDVYVEAKKRINHIIDIFDTLVVCFSGGKDSLCVLKLVEEVYAERGIAERINVIFRDEELIPDDVISFVREHTKNPKYNFYYFAVPLYSHKFILGKTFSYVQWDENRKWIRPKPDIAIKKSDVIYDQYTMDEYVSTHFSGRQAFLSRAETKLS